MSITTRAAIWDGTMLDVHDDVTVRDLGDADEVLVELDAVGLCRSDLSPMLGKIPSELPVILGHEAVGRVTATGSGARELSGARVVLSPVRSCGICRRCAAGSPTTCLDPPEGLPTPFARRGSPVAQFVRLGAFAHHTIVHRRQVVPIPDGIPAPAAALLGCAAVTGVGAVLERAHLLPGDTAVVLGAGGIGLCAVQGARMAGASRILVCDANPAKEEISRRLGATDFAATETADDLRTAITSTSGSADVAIDCVGIPALLEVLVDALAPGGRAVIVGLPSGGATIEVTVRGLFADKAVLGCRMGGADPHRMIPWLAERYLDGSLLLDEMVTTVAPLGEISRLVEELEAGALDRGVMTFA